MEAVLTSDEATQAAQALGLLPQELHAIGAGLGRQPTRTELAVFAGMWSEHCSYKSTKHWLKDLPKDGAHVLAGPGSHAGAVAIDDEWAVAFKIESHNHPSAVEPYQGAATGVGGILRDVIAQGARPCAVLDVLCFGVPKDPRTRHLKDGVVAGIAGYGNAFGVPNVGGRTFYDPRYEGNPLVNAMAVGLVRRDGMRTARAEGVGNALIYVGAATGRDGILGAAFASEELADDTVEDRPHVQVGDPFTGKKLMEACIRFDASMGLIACQDMGACGLTCASIEMAAAGGVGIELSLDTIPLREADMTAQEIMLSESQERFLFCVQRGCEERALAHFAGFGVHAVVCGRVVEGDRARVSFRGEVVVDVPAELVVSGFPPTHWPIAAALPRPAPYPAFGAVSDLGGALLQLLADPRVATKSDVYVHYDQTVGNRTVRGPDGAEAAVLKLPNSSRGFALTTQSRGDWCAADPYLGAQALLAAALRELACAGADMIAITDGLNVASPRDPIENRKLYEVIRGLGDGLRALDVPVTGGNCSLYNESPSGPIPPTPMIGAVGIVPDIRCVPHHKMQRGDRLLLVGALQDRPCASIFGALRSGSLVGDPPAVDLGCEQRIAAFVRGQVQLGRVRAAKSVGMGGVATALAKLAVLSGIGADLRLALLPSRPDWCLFGEYPGLAWLAAEPDAAAMICAEAEAADIPLVDTGAAGGNALRLAHDGSVVFDLDLGALRSQFGDRDAA